MADTSNRGFASMDPDKQKEIASQGGKAAHESGKAHEFDSEEAAEAGRKGGEVVSKDKAHMAEIGRKGGEASGGQRGEKSGEQEGGQSGQRGGTSEQHAKAGSQSHKNQ